MNQYSELLNYLKQLAEADNLVNTVTKGDFEKVDLEKANIFPLVHINISGASFTNGNTIVFNVQIGAFDIRDINKEVSTDKFWEQDNEVDNHNETLAISPPYLVKSANSPPVILSKLGINPNSISLILNVCSN